MTRTHTIKINHTRKALCTLCMLICAYFITSSAIAQTATPPTSIALNNTHTTIPIGQELYNAPKKTSSPLGAYNANLKNKNMPGNVINLDHQDSPATFITSIKNRTQEENWVLSFGRTLEGRNTHIKTLLVQNISTGQTLIDTQNKKGQLLSHSAASLLIPPNTTQTFLIEIRAENIFPNTIHPTLSSHNQYINAAGKRTLFSNTLIAGLVLLIGIVAATSLIHRNAHHIYFILYIALYIAIIGLSENALITAGSSTLNVTMCLFAATLIPLSAATHAFFRNQYFGRQTSKLFLLSAPFPLLGYAISLLLPEDYFFLSKELIYIPLIISAVVGLFFSLVLSSLKRTDGIYLSASWTSLIAALINNYAIIYNILPSSIITLNIYWLLIIVQSLLYITAALKKDRLDEETTNQRIAKEKRAARSKARLEQSKELSDQSRLLRVIERERELMSELREREMQRTEEMRIAKNMADEANRAKSAFLAVVSHEVRNPMNAIMGMIRLMGDGQMTKQQHEYLGAMQTSGETMMALLNDILDFEKIESGNLTLEIIDFDMMKIVQDVITLMTGHAAEKDIQIGFEVGPNFPKSLKGDPTRLRQIILNLVNNAIKFTDEGHITIHLSAEAQSKRLYTVNCAVEDTGIGISKEAQETLFQPFTQADQSTTRKYGGTGLGLTICRRLVEAMNGKMNLTSEEGKGSTFSFRIKMEIGQNNFAENANDIGIASQKKADPASILIIDDNEMNRRVLKGFLEKDNHTIAASEDAEYALQLCTQKDFDLIITDIQLKGMSGIDFVKNLRIFPNKKIAATPVIALSGNTSQKDIRTYYQANINGFLPKPIDPDALNTILLRAQNNDFDQKVILPEKSPPQPPKPEETEQQEEQNETEDSATPKSEEDTSEILKAVQNMQKDKITAAKFKIDETGSIEKEKTFSRLDLKILQSMTSNLDKDKVEELINSCTDHAETSIAELQSIADEENALAMIEKGHELKGMLANFGLKAVSELAGDIEQAGKDGNTQAGIEAIRKLPETYKKTMADLKLWIEKL